MLLLHFAGVSNQVRFGLFIENPVFKYPYSIKGEKQQPQYAF